MSDTAKRTSKMKISPKELFAQYWTLLPFLLLVVMFELVPLFSMVTHSVSKSRGSGLTLENFQEVFSRPIYQTAIKNSLTLTIFSSVVGIVLVFITAMALYRTQNKFKSVYMSMLTLTSNFTGIPLAYSFITILGYTGVFVQIGKQIGLDFLANFDLYTIAGLGLLYIYFQLPMGTLLLLPAFEGIHKEWQESAELMSASSFQFWIKVGVPVMMPSILGTFTMLFANALTAYATPYLLTGASVPILPIKVADLFVGDLRSRPELGSALSLVLLVTMLVVIVLSNLVKRAFMKGEK